MAAAAELHGDPRSGVSPELVLVDAVLSAEVRHLLVVPEDTLERLLECQRGGSRPEAVEQAPELRDYSTTDDEITDHQALAETYEEEHVEPSQDSTAGSVTLQPAASAEERADLLNDVASVMGRAHEHTPSDRVEQVSNSYPTLPSPPPEHAQKDATDSVLRLITGLPSSNA